MKSGLVGSATWIDSFNGQLCPAGRMNWGPHPWLGLLSWASKSIHLSLDETLFSLHHVAQLQSFLKTFTFTTCGWEELDSSGPMSPWIWEFPVLPLICICKPDVSFLTSSLSCNTLLNSDSSPHRLFSLLSSSSPRAVAVLSSWFTPQVTTDDHVVKCPPPPNSSYHLSSLEFSLVAFVVY